MTCALTVASRPTPSFRIATRHATPGATDRCNGRPTSETPWPRPSRAGAAIPWDHCGSASWHPLRKHGGAMACRASEPRDDASLRDGRGRWWWGWLVLLWILRPSEARAEAPKVDGPAPLELSAGPPDDPVRLRLGASVWVRGEIHQQPETTWAVPQRTRVEAQARWRGLSSFVQIQDVRSWGTEPSTTSTPATTGCTRATSSWAADGARPRASSAWVARSTSSARCASSARRPGTPTCAASTRSACGGATGRSRST